MKTRTTTYIISPYRDRVKHEKREFIKDLFGFALLAIASYAFLVLLFSL